MTQDLVSGLNQAQAQAVTSASPHLLVLAGAGSGKTRVLVHRMGWLMQKGLQPHQIMAVTFTNKAASEMRARIEALMGYGTQAMWVGTFHGIAHRLLRTHWQQAGLPEQFQILDSEDQLRLVKRVLQELSLDEEKWPARQQQWFINQQKDEGRRAEQVPQGHDPFSQTQVRIYQHYETLCQRSGMLDFADLLLRAKELWMKCPDLLAHYQRRFQHVLVDEFQDTNTIQYDWLKLLAADQIDVTVVGDDDQSIYGWRGAKIENIHQFGRDYQPHETVRLEQNYRSTACILQAANGVIANNGGRLGKELWTDGHKGDPIELYAAFNELEEARYVAEKIQTLAAAGRSYQDMAILYRSNAQSRVMEEALLRAQLPYRIYGGFRFFERAEIKNTLAYVRLMQSRQDDAAFERVINLPTRGVGGKTLDLVRERARTLEISLFDAAQQLITGAELPSRARSALAGFIDLVAELAQYAQDQTLSEAVEFVIQRTGLVEHYQKEKGEKGRARIENLQELVTAAREFNDVASIEQGDAAQGAETHAAIAAFLDHAALESGDLQADADQDSVQLMTLHSAKGLEFPVVFLVGVEEGVFPSSQSIDDVSRLEEERRLCYVGITRAMQKLFITHAESRRVYGRDKMHMPSRFIREIPDNLIEAVRPKSFVARPASYRQSSASQAPYQTSPKMATSAVSEGGFQLGERVRHNTFGEGTILGFEGTGAHARVQVNFVGQGSKWLVLQYAKLTSVSECL